MDFKILLLKYKDIVLYLFFGVCTTLVNVIAYWICAHPLDINTMTSTIIAWVLAVLFAYITNRNWVFQSEAHTSKDILKEIMSFFGCRFATGIVDWACMFIFVQLFCLNDIFVKVATNVLVVVLNYVASKIIIFRKK